MVKNLPANTRLIRDTGSVPGLGRSPREGNGNSLQYCCLESPMDRGAWQATVQRVAKRRTQMKRLSKHTVLPAVDYGLGQAKAGSDMHNLFQILFHYRLLQDI